MLTFEWSLLIDFYCIGFHDYDHMESIKHILNVWDPASHHIIAIKFVFAKVWRVLVWRRPQRTISQKCCWIADIISISTPTQLLTRPAQAHSQQSSYQAFNTRKAVEDLSLSARLSFFNHLLISQNRRDVCLVYLFR